MEEKIRFRKATEEDMSLIKKYIEHFRLDDESLSPEQFVIAEKKGKLAGFGRIKPYRNCYELGCVGVLEEYRNQGIGEQIVKKLIFEFPTKEVWITTDMPEYFAKFGFEITNDAPEEIKAKIGRVCLKKLRSCVVIMKLQK